MLAEGRREDLAPQTSLTEGAEVELKLVEIDLHDGSAAVGKLDGMDVVVADAAKLVGKKAKVTIGRVLEGQAFATLVAGDPGVAPITFESEAEKPTRAPARRKSDEPEAAEPEADATVETEPEGEDADAVMASEAEPEEVATDEDGSPTPAKKRTRRGSRGGKRRKKPAATVDDADADAGEQPSEPGASAEAEAPPAAVADAPVEKPATPKRRAPRIHVPDDGATDESTEPETAVEETPSAADGDGDGAATRKRTRRGSRGGRNRKKKATAAVNGDGAEPAGATEPDAAETAAVELEANGDGAPQEREPSEVAVEATDAPAESPGEAGYVPMSEWIEDFDRRA